MSNISSSMQASPASSDQGPSSGLSSQERKRASSAGARIEVISNGWMVIEAAVAIGAGIVAHSVLLTAFGIDSVLELVTGVALLWRLLIEARQGDLERVERAENRAAWITGVGLTLLCVYIVILGVGELLIRHRAESSPLGLGVALVALGLMPWLAWRKRDIAARLGSAALRGDAACSITCAYMAAALFVGLALNALLGWWWADGIAALALLFWLVPEAREALEGARTGRAACGCGDDACERE